MAAAAFFVGRGSGATFFFAAFLVIGEREFLGLFFGIFFVGRGSGSEFLFL